MLDWLELPSDDPDDLAETVRRQSPAEEQVLRGADRYFDGDFAGAAAEFAKALQHDPLLFAAGAAEVDALVRAGRLDDAAARADAALQSFGRVPVFYAAKAIVLAHQGAMQAAYEHSDVAVRENADSAFTWLARAEVVLAAGMSREMRGVETCLENAFRRDATCWQARARAALVLLYWGFPERARQRAAEAAKVVADRPFLWKLMGDCCLRLERPLLARERYERALEVRPGYVPARRALRSFTFLGRLRNRLGRLFGRR